MAVDFVCRLTWGYALGDTVGVRDVIASSGGSCYYVCFAPQGSLLAAVPIPKLRPHITKVRGCRAVSMKAPIAAGVLCLPLDGR